MGLFFLLCYPILLSPHGKGTCCEPVQLNGVSVSKQMGPKNVTNVLGY